MGESIFASSSPAVAASLFWYFALIGIDHVQAYFSPADVEKFVIQPPLHLTMGQVGAYAQKLSSHPLAFRKTLKVCQLQSHPWPGSSVGRAED